MGPRPGERLPLELGTSHWVANGSRDGLARQSRLGKRGMKFSVVGVGWIGHALAPVIDAPEVAHWSEARSGIGLLLRAGVLTIAEADNAPLRMLAALAIMTRSLQLSSRR